MPPGHNLSLQKMTSEGPDDKPSATVPAAQVARAIDRIVVAGVALTARALSEGTSESDLSLPQWRVLVVLGEATEPLRLSDIAAHVGVTLPATSRQLRRLERRGLIEIRPHERDRRAVSVALTPAGERVRDVIVRNRLKAIRGAIREVAVDREGAKQLSRLAAALDQFR
jgi:DNA-binding MarR family transcriptional regulator